MPRIVSSAVPVFKPRAPKLLDRVRVAIRLRHYSRRTEESYVAWIRRFILFHGKRHPSEIGAREISAFPSHLASRRRVGSSTQNQALSTILFLYGDVLGRDLGWLDRIVRAQRPARVPAVRSRAEVAHVLNRGRRGVKSPLDDPD